MNLSTSPVGLPALAVLGVGGVAFFLALFIAGRRVAGRPAEPGSRRIDPVSLVWIGVQGFGIALAAIGPVRVLLDPLSTAALAQAGLVLLLMAGTVGLFEASARALRHNWAVVAQTRADQQLVETGPFALVRNPIYLALFLLLLAFAVAYGHWRNLIAAVPVFWIGTWFRVRLEEALLRERFGAAFDAYARRVKRFVPGLI